MKKRTRILHCGHLPVASFLTVLLSFAVALSGWCQDGREEAPPDLDRIWATPDVADQPIIEATKVPASKSGLLPYPVEPLEVTPKPPMPPPPTSINRESEFGTQVKLSKEPAPAPDFSSMIASMTWYPKVSRGEDGSYWAVCRRQGTYIELEIYRNTGDPASSAWVWVVGLSHPGSDLVYADIEVVSSADRCFVLYMIGNSYDVECFWFQLSDPTNNGITTAGDAYLGGYLSLASDEVEYAGNVYLYACWKAQEIPAVEFTRSLDLGLSWETIAWAGDNVYYMYTANAITYCPGDNHVFITWTNASRDVFVSESSGTWGSGTWSWSPVMSSATVDYLSCGITSMYDDYILVSAHGPMSGTDLDVIWVYSEDHGGTWSGINYFNWLDDQTYPSCTSNDDGYFSMFYYAEDTERMESSVATYNNLTSWTYGNVDDVNGYSSINSACMEDGGFPHHGGAWHINGVLVFSYFGWVGGSSSNLEVSMWPEDPPVVIPAGGGSFVYNIYAENNATYSQTWDAWVDVTLPNGTNFGPVSGPFNLTKPAGWSATFTKTQGVPSGAPEGVYSWNIYFGDYPNSIWICDNFLITKLGVGDGESMGDWFCDGRLFPDEILSTQAPDEVVLVSTSPNPFNPTTSISYSLMEAARINLSVYDINGRLVAKLADGYREAGIHKVTFDGSNMASGVYIYRLHAGKYTASGKMVLMK